MNEYERLRKLSEEAKSEVLKLNIPIGKTITFKVGNLLRAFGNCTLKRNIAKGDYFIISIASTLLQAGSDTDVKDTIIHELIHTVDGCMNHGYLWKSYADKVNRAYTQYHISRTGMVDSLENSSAFKSSMVATAKYVLKCECGKEVVYGRKGKIVDLVARNYPSYMGGITCRMCGRRNSYKLIQNR